MRDWGAALHHFHARTSLGMRSVSIDQARHGQIFTIEERLYEKVSWHIFLAVVFNFFLFLHFRRTEARHEAAGEIKTGG